MTVEAFRPPKSPVCSIISIVCCGKCELLFNDDIFQKRTLLKVLEGTKTSR